MKLAVLVAVYNEKDNIRPFYDRAKKVLESLEGLKGWELVFVNDASTDDSLEEILRLRGEDSRVKVLTLSRNFGYHSVLVAGLTETEADLYAMVDVDGEDPPELLEGFYRAIREGAQVAYGIRSNREEPAYLTWLRGLFYWINRKIGDSTIVLWMAEFMMIKREVRDALLKPRTTYPFLRAEVGYVGFNRTGVAYRRQKRMHGESHYNLWRMTRFAVGAFLSSSTFPLRFVLYLSAALAAGFPVAWIALGWDQYEAAVWAVLGGFYFLLAAAPMIALYLARDYHNTIGRPVYFLDPQKTHR
jgi:dolichol-phosphate mannosyltransferase